jgi:hypothetical protein
MEISGFHPDETERGALYRALVDYIADARGGLMSPPPATTSCSVTPPQRGQRMSRPKTQQPDQFIFTFDAPEPATNAADLAGLDRMIAASVARALRDDSRTREDVAWAMSELLGEEVTRFMLDAYASEARDNHNISAGRFFALIAATSRHDILDHVLRRIGAAVLVGEEIATARAGHLRCTIKRLQGELKQVEHHARPIGRVET